MIKNLSWLLEDWATIDGGGPEASKQGRIRPVMGMMGMRRVLQGRAPPGTPV